MNARVESPAARLQAAHRFYGMGEFPRALDALLGLPSEERKKRDALLLEGALLARLRRTDDAIAAFSALLAEDPDCHEALTWMAYLRRDPQNMGEALGYARRAVELRPDDATGFGVLGSGYLAAREPERAIEALLRAVELAPDVAEHRHNLALALLMAHRHGEAIIQLRQAMALAPSDPQSYLILSSTYALYGMAGQAIECLAEGLSHLPDSAPLHSAAGGAFAMIRNDVAAERHHMRALELSSSSRGGYATWLLNQGRFDKANAILGEMVDEGADPGFAYYGLMQSRKLTDSQEDDAFVAGMRTRLDQGGLRARGEMFLHYALGRAEEQRDRYGDAMAHFDEANRLAQRLHHRGIPSIRRVSARSTQACAGCTKLCATKARRGSRRRDPS